MQTILNALLWPSGTLTSADDVYVAAPPTGMYEWTARVVACPDTSPPSGATAPDCTGTSAALPTIHFIGPWGDSVFNVYFLPSASRFGSLSIGDSQNSTGTAVDGYDALTVNPPTGGEVRVNFEQPIRFRIVDNGDSYAGNSGTGPNGLECLGCRGITRSEVTDDGTGAFNISNQAIFGTGLETHAEARLTTAYAASKNFIFVFGGPQNNSVAHIKTRNGSAATRDTTCSTGCGDLTIIADMEGGPSASGAVMTVEAWDSIRVRGRLVNSGASDVAAIEFAPDNSPTVHPMRYAQLGPLDIRGINGGSFARGALVLKSCSGTISPRFDVTDTRIWMHDGNVTNAGGIYAGKEFNAACTIGHGDAEMPPIVRVSGYGFAADSANDYPYTPDVSTNDVDGIYISEAGQTYSWFTNDVADVAAGECLNFAQDSDGTDMHLPCTDERTMLRPSESSGLFVAWSRVDIGNDAIDAGEGCNLQPNFNGTPDSDADHTLISGDDANIEAVDTTASAYINRYVAAGEYFQLELEDAASDNCTDHIGVRWSAHVIPVGTNTISDAPFGDAQP